MVRVPSPPLGFSILITVAPMSARNMVAKGAAAAWLKSSTRRPASGSEGWLMMASSGAAGPPQGD